MIAHVITFSAFRSSAALKILEKLGINDLGYSDPIEWERKAYPKRNKRKIPAMQDRKRPPGR